VLAHHAVTIGDKPVYHYMAPRVTTPETLTYRELHDHSCKLASVFQQHGLLGKYVLLTYPPGLEFVEAFFGCMRGSVSAIPMYIPPGNVPDSRMRSIISTIEIAAVLTVKAKQAQVREQIAGLFPEKECQVICTDELLQTIEVGVELSIDLEQPPLIQFTSGSTSNPKGVVVSHANLMANQRMIERGFRRHAQTRGGETMVSWLPFFHDMGLIWGIMYPVFIGGSVILMSPTDFLHNPHKWLQLISMHAASISGAPNFAYEYCVSRIRDEQIDGLDLSGWDVAYSGSEMIRPMTMKRFCNRFSSYGFRAEAMFYCYGMAETTLYVSGGTGIPDSTSSPSAVASVGLPDEEAEVVIVDENGNVLPEGHTGEVWVRGPHVARGYINNPEATGLTFSAKPRGNKSGPSYLRTGDLGYLIQGNLHIVGRIKNLIIVNGKNYYGEEIEYFVSRSHEYFLESGACILQTNEGFANSEVIFIQEIQKSRVDAARADLPYLEEKALQLSRQILDEFKLSVHRFIFLGATRLPRTSSGKIDRVRANDFAMGDTCNFLLDVDTR
jgi:acyl-CoA synthetase (AMP-forming)/AMP-acid ligase II